MPFLICFTGSAQVVDKPNFIFIIVDDLNDFVQPFTNDQPQMITPHLKQLSDAGTTFMNAFTTAPGCAPSRTSFLSGKDLTYTQVYNNNDYVHNFRSNFTAEKGNETVFTIPEILKDSGGYFTFGVSKIFHAPDNNDFDNSVTPECEKSASWNRMIYYDLDTLGISDASLLEYAFNNEFDWGMIPDSVEYKLTDCFAVDTAAKFIHDYASGAETACGNPFFLCVGIKYPHSPLFVPESYFQYYLNSIYDEPYEIPYNHPKGTFPYNGIVMPPQPDPVYNDYFALPPGGIARASANSSDFFETTDGFYDSLEIIPEIDPALDDSIREYILEESIRANFASAYMAAIEFADAQIGKVVDAVNAHPDLSGNTIIVLISDHGYSLGEKRHWAKWALWETDNRIPFIIVDPSKPTGQIVNQPVSTLDLFPTICDLAGINYPRFPDGTNYLDGNSLVPLLENPDLIYELPALTSTKKTTGVGSCYPSVSIRDDRFHLITYRQNNNGAGAVNFCDSLNFSFEEELYEIGSQRETDPHEWNNLISNDDYQPVIQFMHQFLPDSNLYLTPTFTATIRNNPLNCFLAHDDTLHLYFDWLDTLGNIATLSPFFTYKWSNNLTTDLFYGTAIEFPIQLISDALFTSTERVMIYLQVYDEDNRLIGFDTKYYYINPANMVDASFNLENTLPLTTQVIDFSISGSYNSYWWDFGFGSMFYNELPGPYTYPAPGIYEVTLYVQYGNDCVESFHQDFISVLENKPSSNEFMIIPNPADFEISLIDDQADWNSVISIFELSGKLIKSIQPDYYPRSLIKISIADLPPGFYILERSNSNGTQSASFIVTHSN